MKIVFVGTAELGIPALERLARMPEHHIEAVVTQPDRPTGRHQKLTFSPIKQAAVKHGYAVHQPEKIKSESFVEIIRQLIPDLMLVAAYGQIISKSILDIPRHGVLNIHASLLPKYRGASPIQAALLNGD